MDAAVIDLVSTADIEALTAFAELIYGISQFDAHGWETPIYEHPALAAIIETARRRHWDRMEARRALAEREPERPGWLLAGQEPPELPPEEPEEGKGIGL